MQKLPVTVLSGFLGAGKTSLLRHLIQSNTELRFALIVNDMSEINIDAAEIQRTLAISRTGEKLVEMSNGCICCTLREDLMIEVEKLAKENRFDYLIIENTGIGEPLPVAQTFSFADEESGMDLSRYSYIDTMVTVVDCSRFLEDFGSAEKLAERHLTSMDGDERTLVNLLTDQIEFADVIILNKIDQVPIQTLGLLESACRHLNPHAKLLPTTFGKVEPREVILTELFTHEKAATFGSWNTLKTDPVSEADEYGIHSFSFRARAPFHPKRFWDFLHHDYPETIIRAKGLFWLASRPGEALHFSQAGGSSRLEKAGIWWAALLPEERKNHPDYPHYLQIRQHDYDPVWEDRKIELVFIGQNLDLPSLKQHLDTCLATPEEFRLWKKSASNDPFQDVI